MKLNLIKGNQAIFIGLLVVQALLLAAIGGAMVQGGKVLKTKSDETIQLKIENFRLDKTQREYLLAKQEVEKYKYYGEVADSVIPKDKELDRVTKELVQIGKDLSMPISSITYPASSLAATMPKTGAASATQTKPAEGIPGLLAIDATISFDSPTTYENALRFIDRLGDNRRKLQISRVNLSNSEKGVLLNIGITIFVKQ
jgi:hypothetical protein